MNKLAVTTKSSVALSILVMNVARIAARSLCQFLVALFSRYFGQGFCQHMRENATWIYWWLNEQIIIIR